MTEFKTRKLRNGLLVCEANQPHLRTMVAAMYIRTGSRYEKLRVNGISHMVEHMLFRGTPKFATAKDHALAVEQLGGSMNAWTTPDMVSYHIKAPAESGTEILDLLLEMFRGPRFEGFEKEKGTVLEEVRSSLGAAGQDLDPGEVIHRIAYGTHPLGRNVAGTVDSVTKLKHSDLVNHYKSEYVAGNMTLVLSGNLSHTKVPKSIPIQTGTRTRTDAVQKPKLIPSTVEFVRNQDSAQVDVIAALLAPGREHKHYLALRVLEMVLMGGMSSRVEQTIREPGLAYHAAARYDAVDDTALFLVSAGTAPDKVVKLVEGMIGLLSDMYWVSEEEFQLAKKQVGWSMDLVQDNPLYLAGTIGWTLNRGKKLDFGKTREKLRKLTIDDLHEASRAMLRDRYLYLAAIGPVADADKSEICRQVKDFAKHNYSGPE